MNEEKEEHGVKKLLIVVDYQKDFVDGALGFPGAEKLAERIQSKMEAYRKAGDEVVFTFDTHTQEYLQTQEGQNLPVPHCIEGSEGWELYPPLEVRAGEKCFQKPTFGSAELFDYLRTQRYESIELVGLVSSICVISNAVLAKAAQPETPILIPSDCTDSFDKELHAAALNVMAGLQMKVI